MPEMSAAAPEEPMGSAAAGASGATDTAVGAGSNIAAAEEASAETALLDCG